MAAHREEFASRGQKYQTSLILSSRLSTLHREAVCSSVSSCLRENFGKKFALRGREDKIKHV